MRGSRRGLRCKPLATRSSRVGTGRKTAVRMPAGGGYAAKEHRQFIEHSQRDSDLVDGHPGFASEPDLILYELGVYAGMIDSLLQTHTKVKMIEQELYQRGRDPVGARGSHR